jgi:hypothetical protein
MPTTKKIDIECDYCSFYYKFNRGTYKFYELLCSPTEDPEFMDSRTRKGIHGRGGVRNLVLNLVQQHRRHICEVLEYM